MKRPTLAVVARALTGPLQLLPHRPHRHVFDALRCDPPMCVICGRRGYPLAPHEPHDVFEEAT